MMNQRTILALKVTVALQLLTIVLTVIPLIVRLMK
jgi:hypothetical protein